MPRPDRDDNRSVALYWDFENLHASLFEDRYGEGAYGRPDGRFKLQEPLVDVQAIVELAASFGPVAINRGYCNWQFYGRYRDALLQGGVELVQLFPPGASAKNGADIRLCLDAAEDIHRFGHIETVVIVGGDSDFMPVAQRIKAAGRTLVGVGMRRATNRHWAKSCHEFRYYDSLMATAAAAAAAEEADAMATGAEPQPAAPAMSETDPAAELLCRAVRLLADTRGDPWVSKGGVWHMMKRLDPAFDPREHGHADFPSMVRAMGDMVDVTMGETGRLLRLKA